MILKEIWISLFNFRKNPSDTDFINKVLYIQYIELYLYKLLSIQKKFHISNRGISKSMLIFERIYKVS